MFPCVTCHHATLRTSVPLHRPFLSALFVLAALWLTLPAIASAATFSNNDGPITINDGDCVNPFQAKATPYPSTISVSGVSHTIDDVDVTLTGFKHTNPDDLRVLLVGPQGQTTLLLQEDGGSGDVNNLTLTFDDAAVAPPTVSALTSGSYKPSSQSEAGCINFSATSSFPSPAPTAGTGYGSTLSGFNGASPNGDWKLYVVDNQFRDVGSIDRWSIALTLMNAPPDCSAVVASPGELKADTRFRRVTLSGASDLDGDPLSYKVDGVTQDEPVSSGFRGDTTIPDAQGASRNGVELRSERNPRLNGRVYRIAYTVSDGFGGDCSGSAKVAVPVKKGVAAVDDGDQASWNSFSGALIE